MEILLKKEQQFKTVHSKDGDIQVLNGKKIILSSIEENRQNFADFFSSKEDISFKDTVVSLIDPETMKPYENIRASLKCMFNDIKDEDSWLYFEMSKIFTDEDVVLRKVNIGCYLLEQFYNLEHGDYANLPNHKKLVCKSISPSWTFSFYLPTDLVEKMKIEKEYGIDMLYLVGLSASELAKYVLPAYYKYLENSANLIKDESTIKHWREFWIGEFSFVYED